MGIQIRGMAPLLQVFDMPASLAFYRDLLGFAVVATDRPGGPVDWALLRRDGVEVMLNTAYEGDARPPAPDPARVAAHADTCIYLGCPDVDAACAWLRGCGVEVGDPVVQGYGMKQLYLTDPDGFMVCLQWPADPPEEPA